MTVRFKRKKEDSRKPAQMRRVYPFTAIVGQKEMLLALLLNAIAPAIGGALIMGERGTGKTTAVRALADLLPHFEVVSGCHYNCDPKEAEKLCEECVKRLETEGRLARRKRAAHVVELPLGATEDRVCGTLNVERALKHGERAFEPGLLARANRGFLYIDEVNLLEDHLVDVLLDASVSGVNRVEREGVSFEHPSRFVLIGSGNPEEGELRPQLLDRFGLFTEVKTNASVDERVQVVERCESFARDADNFVESFRHEQEALRRRIARARKILDSVEVSRDLLIKIAELCARLSIDGHRGELTITRAARSLAALEGRRAASIEDVRRVAPMCLRHRLRRDPLERSSGGAKIENELNDILETKSATGSKSNGEPVDSGRADSGDGANSLDVKNSFPDSVAGHTDGAQQRTGDANTDGKNFGGVEKEIGPAKASLPENLLESERSARAERNFKSDSVSTAPSRRAKGRRTQVSEHGRCTGAMRRKEGSTAVSVDATLRARALRESFGKRRANGREYEFKIEDVRFKRFSRKSGTLHIVAVDVSGSMALNRIAQAKGAIEGFLRKSYVRRDRVALVTFREKKGEIALSPTSSMSRARRVLDALPVGGATPLAAGLARAVEVAARANKEGAQRITLILFTDGRANVTLSQTENSAKANAKRDLVSEIEMLGAELLRQRVAAFIIDTGNRYASGGEAVRLASRLRGEYIRLPFMSDGSEVAERLSRESSDMHRSLKSHIPETIYG